jgi:PKHD-type hydroxylase
MKLSTIRIEDSFCSWNDLFTEDEIDEIVKYCEEAPRIDGQIGAGAGEKLDIDIRKSKVSFIERNEENNWFFSRIQAASNKLNSKFFGFDIEVLNTMQYTVYDEEGSHYDWHWDIYTGNALNNLEDIKQRKLTSVLQLDNPDDYEEGFLQLNSCGTISEVDRKKGYMVCFPSFLVHRVTPVKSGKRRTLVAWFNGPDWR